jgi:Holliday junction resolvase RusA-like endonuclease
MILQDNLVDPTLLKFWVSGEPAGQGSKKGFLHKHTKRVVIVDDNPVQLRNWRNSIIQESRDAMAGRDPISGAVVVGATFAFLRPANHYGARGGLLPSAPIYRTTQPDLDKLLRALLDGLTAGGVFEDDKQVIGFSDVQKVFGSKPGAQITVRWDPARRP